MDAISVEYEKESSERRGLPEKDDPDQNRADCTDTRPDGIGRPDGQCFQHLRYDRQAQRDRTDRARNPQRLFRSCGFFTWARQKVNTSSMPPDKINNNQFISFFGCKDRFLRQQIDTVYYFVDIHFAFSLYVPQKDKKQLCIQSVFQGEPAERHRTEFSPFQKIFRRYDRLLHEV